MSEKKISQQIMRAMSIAGSRLFRNHVGVAFQGKPIRFSEETTVKVRPGDILVRQARTVTAGLITGSSDLIGWTPRMITEYDLGKLVAIFTAVEVKSADGIIEPAQEQFLRIVKESGGLGIIARSADDALKQVACLPPSAQE